MGKLLDFSFVYLSFACAWRGASHRTALAPSWSANGATYCVKLTTRLLLVVLVMV